MAAARRPRAQDRTGPPGPRSVICAARIIEKDGRWTQGRLRWDHVIVLPNAKISDDFALPDCPRWKVIDRDDLPTLVDKLRYVLESAFERSRERLYVGLSRARDQLVVCGDPDFIRKVGGPDLAQRLNLSSAQ